MISSEELTSGEYKGEKDTATPSERKNATAYVERLLSRDESALSLTHMEQDDIDKIERIGVTKYIESRQAYQIRALAKNEIILRNQEEENE